MVKKKKKTSKTTKTNVTKAVKKKKRSLNVLKVETKDDKILRENELLEKLQEEHTRERIAFPIVGIGGSAGALEAAQVLIDELSISGQISYVLIQHLDPSYVSALSEILNRKSRLPVIEAYDNMLVEPNKIYVIPPNSTLFLQNNHLKVHKRKSGLHTPIDSFFHSLAEELGKFAIGVILSGTGSDGVSGTEAIKAQGGTVFAQDARTAKYSQMPVHAIATGCVDFILPPKEIARKLMQISQNPDLPRAKEIALLEHMTEEDRSAYRKILNLLHISSKVDFTNYKQSTIQRRLYRRMFVHKIVLLKEYALLLKSDPKELEALYNELLINVTSFFRNPKTFQELKEEIIPEILSNRDSDKGIRIWVPGCSSGQEVYSLLICFCEILGDSIATVKIQAFATDISELAIEQARLGIYSKDISEDVSADRLRRFFIKLDDGRYQIIKTIRDMCVFAKQNVYSDPPFSNIDMVCCRNLLIYFDLTLQKKVIPIFHYSLRNSGILLLGSSESINFFPDLFVAKDKIHSIYVKKQIPNRKPHFEFPARTFYQPNVQPEVKQNFLRTSDVLQELRDVSEDLLLENFSPSCVIVNEDLEVIHLHGDTAPFLSLRPGTATLNLLKIAKDTLPVDLRILLHKVKKDGHHAKKEHLTINSKGNSIVVSIEVFPLKSAKVVGQYFLIVFHQKRELGKSPKKVDISKKQKSLNQNKSDRISELMNELDELKEALQSLTEGYQSTIEAQEAINEEIKTSNEELLSSNEELQSTTEELETAKEELHSTNEELSTVNVEIQNRNFDLLRSNSDLSNLFESVHMPVVMLGSDLRIRKMTPNAQEIFNLIPSDIGRPITDIQSYLLVKDLPKLIESALSTMATKEKEIQNSDGHWYLLRIHPFLTDANTVDGVVMVLLDIHSLKTALDFTHSIIDSLQNAVVVFDRTMKKIFAANPAFYDLIKVSKDETRNATIFNIKKGILDLPVLHDLIKRTDSRDLTQKRIHELLVPGKKSMDLVFNTRLLDAVIPGLDDMILLSIQDLTDLRAK